MDNNLHDDVTVLVNECSYIDCNDFQGNVVNNFDILHVNARSLNKNYDELVSLLSCLKHTFSVIGISETWLKSTSDINLFQIPGYSFVHVCRSDKLGGGVGLYVKDGLDSKFRSDLSGARPGYESIFVELSGSNRKTVVGCVYRAPNSDSTSFCENFELQLQSLSRVNKDVYIMGDYNLNLLNYDVDPKVKDFVDLMNSFGLFSLITKPTRISQNTATLIDNIFTNCIHNDFDAGVLCSDISDHLPIFCVNKGNFVDDRSNDQATFKRLITDERILTFQQKLLLIDWQAMYLLDNPNESYEYFIRVFTNLYNQCFPCVKKINKKKIKKPWITFGLLNSINRKHNLYSKYVKTPNDANKKKYVDYKNILIRTLRLAKQKFYDNLFQSVKGDIRKTWTHINELLGRGKKHSIPTEMFHEGSSLLSNKQKAECFNKYFIGLPAKISREIPTVPQSFHEYLQPNIDNASLFFRPTSVLEIINFVSSLKSSKSSGSDDIAPRVIKECIYYFVDPLCFVFNNSLSQGIVPSKLKVAKVVPVYKKDDKKNIVNYRPIALLPIFSKILEKIVYKRLNEFLLMKNVLIPQQFGFRKHFSTSMGVFNLLNYIIKSFDDGNFCLGIFLDLSKAFDTIDHGILLSKLEHYGVRGVALSWFRSYLQDRTQFVMINGVKSLSGNIHYGVPQGSVLGPLLFLIYINDVVNSSNLFMYSLFADDTSLLMTHKNIVTLMSSANVEIKRLLAWFCCNKLLLNVSKTKCIIFRSKGKIIPDNVDILNVGGHNVVRSEHVQFLGVTIDEHLSWKPHLESVCTKVSRGVGVICRLRYFLPDAILKTLYTSIVLPYLTYCNVAWGNTFKTYIEKLKVLQKKILRIITNSTFRHPSKPLFIQLKLLPLDDLVAFNCLIFMFKLHFCPQYCQLKDLFALNSQVHNYNTRQRNLIHRPYVRTNVSLNSFRTTCIKEWNQLPAEIKNCTTLYRFKVQCKKYLFDNLS